MDPQGAITALSQGKLPKHVAIIMDGNGRWAKAKGWPRYLGHREGAKRADELIRFASDLGIQELTLYAFSEENWRRPNDEVSFLMRLLASYIRKLLKEAQKNNIRFKVIGRVEKLPEFVRSMVFQAMKDLDNCTGMTLTLALSYSGREEIADAARDLCMAAKKGEIEPEDVNAAMLGSFLPSQFMHEPDLLIRTSGEQRVSNFLLWQLAYAEMVFVDEMWPDFKRDIFFRALQEYQGRDRRFGGVISHPNPPTTQAVESDHIC